MVARYVPVDMIYEALSEAKQEGKVKRKLYTKIIMERGKSYLAPYLKNAKHTEEAVIIPDEEAKRIKLELDKEKEEFEEHQKKYMKQPLTEEEKDEINRELAEEQEKFRIELQMREKQEHEERREIIQDLLSP